MTIFRSAALAAVLLSGAATSSLAGIRLGVAVRNVEAIPGAHVVTVDSEAPGGSILKLKPGDLIRYVKVDDSEVIWRTTDMLELIAALRQTKRKVVVYYLRGGGWHKGEVRMVDAPDGGEPRAEGEEGKPCDDPREKAEETGVPRAPAG